MHIINDKSLQQPDYNYIQHGKDTWFGYHKDSKPFIQYKHIDGPVLFYRDGQLHWLTIIERVRCWLKLDDAYSIERKRRPELGDLNG